MAKQEWILGQPVQTDTTNFEWLKGCPYIVTEEAAAAGSVVPIIMQEMNQFDGGTIE